MHGSNIFPIYSCKRCRSGKLLAISIAWARSRFLVRVNWEALRVSVWRLLNKLHRREENEQMWNCWQRYARKRTAWRGFCLDGRVDYRKRSSISCYRHRQERDTPEHLFKNRERWKSCWHVWAPRMKGPSKEKIQNSLLKEVYAY